MGEAKFTPGPWFCDTNRHGDPLVCESANGLIIADVLAVDSSDEHERNQALIAAAPDLYEALTRLHDAADEALGVIDHKRERGDFSHWESFSMGDLGAAIHDARAALAKACPTPVVAATDNEGGEHNG